MDNIEYTWDESKRQKTIKDRGLDFADMEKFMWETSVLIQDLRNPYPELRYISTGFLGQDLVICAWCYRDETIRIISLRKANRRERSSYEKATAALN